MAAGCRAGRDSLGAGAVGRVAVAVAGAGVSRPILLDTFCKAGGATKGYQQAGFYVVGVDIEPQPHYCGDEFILADALEVLRGDLSRYAAIHASPPCQAYTYAGSQWRAAGRGYPDLIVPTRELLIASGLPYVIENVPGSPLINPTILNGPMFGAHVHRTRLFETSFAMPLVLRISPGKVGPRMGRAPKEGEMLMPIGHFSGVPYARREMGIDWMTQGELAQAILPAMTRFIGLELMKHIEVVA